MENTQFDKRNISLVMDMYELTMSNLLYGSDTKSLGVLLYELQTYADTQNASVLSVIILLIVLIGNIILNKVTKGKVSI